MTYADGQSGRYSELEVSIACQQLQCHARGVLKLTTKPKRPNIRRHLSVVFPPS
jgi:hypothetical protein